MVLRSQSVGEQDVADQQGAFCAHWRPWGGPRRPPGPSLSRMKRSTICAETVEPPIPARAGPRSAYSYSPRSDAATASDLRGSTLRTGYCDREIDEDRL